jgi:hypothetical protein
MRTFPITFVFSATRAFEKTITDVREVIGNMKGAHRGMNNTQLFEIFK